MALDMIVEKKNLVRALTAVMTTTDAKGLDLSVSGIYIEGTEDGELILRSRTNDMATEMILTEDLAVQEPGKGVVEPKMFSGLIRKMPAGNLKLKEDNGKLNVSIGEVTVDILLLSADNYPVFPDVKEAQTVTLTQGSFKHLIESVEFAAGTDGTRPILDGICFDVTEDGLEKKKITAVALDGFRMAVNSVPFEGEPGIINKKVVPTGAFKGIMSTLDNKNVKINLSFTDNTILVEKGGLKTIARFIAGDYFKYQSMIPSDISFELAGDSEKFTEALDRALFISSSETAGVSSSPIIIDIADGVRIKAGKTKGNFVETVDLKSGEGTINGGNPFEIAFNGQFLNDAVRRIGTENIRIAFQGPLQPALIREEDNDNLMYIVLPVRITAKK